MDLQSRPESLKTEPGLRSTNSSSELTVSMWLRTVRTKTGLRISSPAGTDLHKSTFGLVLRQSGDLS